MGRHLLAPGSPVSLPTAAAVIPAVGGVAAGWWTARHRRSAAVRRWRPSSLPAARVGALHVRKGGDTGRVVVLLHGLVATGDVFGADFDQISESATLVVPDLLGFGRSLDESRAHVDPVDHLDALDEMLDVMGLASRPMMVGAHSMGSSLAVRWARRRGEQIERVACWGPPVYSDADAVDDSLGDSGLMTELFVANTRWARIACRFNCTHRRMAGLFAAALSPSLPTPIARAASLHTWPAYRDAMELLVARTDWVDCLQAVAPGTTVEMTWGSRDRIGDRDHAGTLPSTSIHIVPGAGHHLPLTHPEICRAQLCEGP